MEMQIRIQVQYQPYPFSVLVYSKHPIKFRHASSGLWSPVSVEI